MCAHGKDEDLEEDDAAEKHLRDDFDDGYGVGVA